MDPTQEEWAEWLQHPVTQWFRAEAEQTRQDWREALATGQTLRESSDDTAQQTAYATGVVAGLDGVLACSPEAFE